MKAISIRVLESVKQHPVLAGILVMGFLLRISGVFWGTPFFGPFEGYYHPDEWNIIQGAIQFPNHAVDNLRFVYPTFFHYFLGILTFPLRIFFEDFSSPTLDTVGSNFYWVVTVVGRLCSVLAGMGAIFLTYLLAKDVLDQKRALLASAFLAFTMLHATNSAVVTPDVLTSFFLVLFLLVLRRAFLKPQSSFLFVCSGMVLGLLVGTKYTGAFAICAMVVLYGYTLVSHVRRENSNIRFDYRKFHGNLLLCGGVALVTFFLTTPGILLHFDAFLDSMNHLMRQIGWKSTPRSDMQTWVTVFHKFERGVGLPLACLFLFGMFFPYKKNVYEWSFLAIVAGFFLYFEAKLSSRYVIFVAPLIAIIASNAVLWLYERSRKPLRVAGYSLIIFVSLYSFGHSATGVYMRLDDTRTHAAPYIHNRFPEETTLGIAYTPRPYSPKPSRWKNHRWRNPRIDFAKFREMDVFDYPEVVIVSSLVKLGPIRKALRSDKLSEEFIWDERYNHEWRRSTPPSPRMFRFYQELFSAGQSSYHLVKTFKKKISVWLEHTPSQIDIYVRQSYGPHMERRGYYPSNSRDYFQEEDMRDWRWQLRVEEGNKAKLRFPAEDLAAIRIAIKKADVGPPWAIQLNQQPVAILNNEAYVLHFRIRADNARSVAVAVGQTSAPWQTVGLYQHVQVTEDWQEYALSFRAEAEEPQARVFFVLGESAVSVEIGDVQLRHKSDVVLASLTRSRQGWRSANELIEPDFPDKFYVDYRFNTMGCRGRDYSIPRTREGARILVLGDSFALGAGVHQEDTLARQLEGLLNQGQKENTPASNYEVINCGVEGYGTQEAARFYETFGSTYAPDIVLLVMAPDDDHSLFQERRQKILRSPGSQFVAWSDQQERLFNRSAPDYSGSLKEVANLQQLVEARGGKLAVVVFRHTQHQAWEPLIQQLTQSFRNTTVQVLDLGETLLASHSEDELMVHEEDKHPNDLAHRLAAQGLRAFLTKKGLLDEQPTVRLEANRQTDLRRRNMEGQEFMRILFFANSS